MPSPDIAPRAAAQVPGRRRALLAGACAWLCVLGLSPPPAARAQVILNAVPGGLVEIPLASLDRPRPQVSFGRNRVLVMAFGRQWVGLVGLPLALVPGKYLVQARLEDGEDPVTRSFTVYPRKIDQDPVAKGDDLPGKIPTIDFAWREPLEAELPLTPPVSVPVRKIFGHYRREAGSAATYVDFVAFRIASDTSVKAPAGGRVAALQAGAQGTFVWLDHGMGLYSRVGPLTQAAVRETDPVESGQRLGRIVLETADEPKALYWSVFLNGAAVDPSLLSDLDQGAAQGASPPPPSG